MPGDGITKPAALRIAAEEMATCTTCGRRHSPIPQNHGRADSWADPMDGHAYRVNDLRAAEWLERRAAQLEAMASGDGDKPTKPLDDEPHPDVPSKPIPAPPPPKPK